MVDLTVHMGFKHVNPHHFYFSRGAANLRFHTDLGLLIQISLLTIDLTLLAGHD